MLSNVFGRQTWLGSLSLVLAGATGALSFGCGSKTMQPAGGETGFLLACDGNADCASGLCACGACSRLCETSEECGSDAKCTAEVSDLACAGESRAVCVANPTLTDAASVGDQSTDQSNATGAEDCHGPGHYEAGKGGEYRPCCEGLTEVLQLGAAEGDDGPACVDLPLRIYACVEGTCGDGVCEVGENVRCGCANDCPDAAWGDPAPTATGTASVIDDGTAPPDCGGFGCENLRVSSPGQVQIEVELEGPFCTYSCGEVRPALYDLDSGLAIYGARMCDPCPEPVSLTPDCPTPSLVGRTWRGEVGITDATCANSLGTTNVCQSAPTYLSAGRYRAEVCSDPSYLDLETGEYRCFDPSLPAAPVEPVCVSVEFDFPSVEPVVLHLSSLPTGVDAGGASTTVPETSVEFDASVSVDASSQ